MNLFLALKTWFYSWLCLIFYKEIAPNIQNKNQNSLTKLKHPLSLLSLSVSLYSLSKSNFTFLVIYQINPFYIPFKVWVYIYTDLFLTLRHTNLSRTFTCHRNREVAYLLLPYFLFFCSILIFFNNFLLRVELLEEPFCISLFFLHSRQILFNSVEFGEI